MSNPFLAAMPAAVIRQRDILTAMLNVVELEPALRWFELGCSLARDGGLAPPDGLPAWVFRRLRT